MAFIFGFILGGLFGIMAMCLFQANSRDDEESEYTGIEQEEKENE